MTVTTTVKDSLDRLEHELLDRFQRDLPLQSRPYALIAERLGVTEATVIDHLTRLRNSGAISRVGPVFRPHRVGTSTLAAMQVPPERLEAVATQVNAFDEVNHNYEREHPFNLWFVATASDEEQLDATLATIERQTGFAVMSLPMEEAYHLDLGFRLEGRQPHQSTGWITRPTPPVEPLRKPLSIRDEADRRLVAAVQGGLPLTPRPYAAVAESIGISEERVKRRLADWLRDGTIGRMGVVVRHRELGFRANGMVVWDVADGAIRDIGRCFGRYDFVTLCYRRPRRLPVWRYNLFCMIHGRDRDEVRERVALLVRDCGLQGVAHEVLFSRRRFKQRGARYINVRPAPTRPVVEA